MKRIATIASVLLLTGGLALAQSSGGSSGGASGSPGGAAGSATPGTVPGTSGPTINSPTAPNGLTTPSPGNSATTGRGPGVNPANPQDLIGRSNPQDLTAPGGRNPQDQVAPGVPNIAVPERR